MPKINAVSLETRSPEHQEIWKEFTHYCRNEGLSQNRIDKLAYIYITFLRGIKNKPLSKLTRKDFEAFNNALNDNTFRKIDGNQYSGVSKADIKKFLKRFWRWYKKADIYPEEVAWIKTRISKDEKPKVKETITIKEVETLANGASSLEYRAIILMLFDSGFRIDEFLSITKKDLTWEEYEGTQKCFWVRCNRSKTVTRKIPIPLFTEDIKNFVNSTYCRELADNDLLFNKEYDAIRAYLSKLTKKVLHKKLTPHHFRHSSATYYARALEGDMIALCQRYGWSLSSDEAKVYVRMSGAYERQTAKKVYSNKTNQLEEEVNLLRSELAEYKKALVKIIASSKKN